MAPDLITLNYLLTVIDPSVYSEAQLLSLPSQITSASRAVRGFCNRYFSRQPARDELYTVPFRGQLVLKQYPVNGISRCASNPTAVLLVANVDQVTNQRATVALATTGDVDAGLVVAGLTLNAWASGVLVPVSIPFAISVTLASAAQAINALGTGWQATVTGGYELWPTADLRAVQGALPAYGATQAQLAIHADDLPFALDELSGVVTVGTSSGDPFDTQRWGPYLGGSYGDVKEQAGFLGTRVVYDCGYDAIPADLQFWVAMAAKSFVEQAQTDTTLIEEHAGADGYQVRPELLDLPMNVRRGLDRWRNVRG